MTAHPLRRPCACGHTEGRIETRSGQDCVFCARCGGFQYNAPRTETGREVRHLRTRPRIPVSQRARILDRDGGRCFLCNRNDLPLDIGHLISVQEGRALGMSDVELFQDENLVALCSPCNSGLGAISFNPKLVMMAVRAARRRKGAA